MAIPTPPLRYRRLNSVQLSASDTFSSPDVGTYSALQGGKWLFTVAIHVQQLDAVATAVEKLYLQDFSALQSEELSVNIDAVIDVDGSVSGTPGTVLNPELTVKLNQVADAPGTYEVSGGSTKTWSPELAWAFVDFVRQDLEIGSYYTP